MLELYKSGEIELIEEWRIGGDTVDEKYIIASPSDIAYDSKGNLFVLDGGDKCIKKYSPEGKHIITFGSEGQGPGEIMRAYQLEIDPEDNVVIYDSGGWRFSKYSNNGETISSNRIREFIWSFAIAPSGDYVINTMIPDWSNKKGTLYYIKSLSPELEFRSVVDSAYVKDNILKSEGGNNLNIPIPFAPSIFWKMHSSGKIITGWSGDYSFKIFSEDLTRFKIFKHASKRVKITDEDIVKYFANMSFSYTEDGKSTQTSRGVPESMKKNFDFPKYKPFFGGIRVDGEGNIFFMTYEKKDDHPVWDVFDENGVFIMKRTIPFMEGKTIFYKDKIAKIRYPEDDFPYIAQYRIKQ